MKERPASRDDKAAGALEHTQIEAERRGGLLKEEDGKWEASGRGAGPLAGGRCMGAMVDGGEGGDGYGVVEGRGVRSQMTAIWMEGRRGGLYVSAAGAWEGDACTLCVYRGAARRAGDY